MKSKYSILALSGSALLLASQAHAVTYYWDGNDSTAGFGAASGTWAAPTPGTLTAGWTTDILGTTVVNGNSVTTATVDSINFGETVNGLAAGTITVTGTVDAGDMTFAVASGQITLSGGTINLAPITTITVNNANNVITSALTGAATSLTKAGIGTLTLSGANTYTGATLVNAGVLQAGVVTQAFGVGSAVTLADVASATLDLNNFNQTIGSLAGGGLVGGNVTLGTATLTTGGDNTSTTYAGVISGSGVNALTKNGTGTFTLSGVNTYTGLTTVNAGTLALSSAGRLASASSLLINGGTLEFATETVSSYQQTGGTLDFDVNSPGVHDELFVSGNATLGGTINVNNTGVEFVRGERADLIDASGDVIGTPDTFTHNYANRMFLVVDDTADIVYILGTGIVGQNGNLDQLPGLSANEQAIAGVINAGIASNGNILDTVVAIDQLAIDLVNGTVSAASLNLLSPETYGGFSDYGVQTIKSYTTSALSMSTRSLDGTARSIRIPVGTASSSTVESMVSAPSTDAVTSVFGGYTHYDTATDSSINGADYDINSNGGILGVRHDVNRFTIAGFIAADRGEVTSSTLDSDVDAFLLGAFAGYMIQPEINLMVTGGVTYGSYDFSGTRDSLGGPVTFDDVGSDVYDIHVAIEGDVYATDKIRVTPFLGLHYIQSETEAFTETGPSALVVDAHDYDALFTEIGIKSEYQLSQQFSVNGNLSYTYNHSGSDKNIGASLGGTPFAVSSPGLGKDFFTIGVGAQYQVTEALRLGANYRAEISSDAETANGFHIGASYSF